MSEKEKFERINHITDVLKKLHDMIESAKKAIDYATGSSPWFQKDNPIYYNDKGQKRGETVLPVFYTSSCGDHNKTDLILPTELFTSMIDKSISYMVSRYDELHLERKNLLLELANEEKESWML